MAVYTKTALILCPLILKDDILIELLFLSLRILLSDRMIVEKLKEFKISFLCYLLLKFVCTLLTN